MAVPGKYIGSLLLISLCLGPLVASAQEGRRRTRGDIHVTNNWRDTVRVTLWKQRGEQISRRIWTIPRGQAALLGDEQGRPIRVQAYDTIKVGENWRRVDVGAVGQLRQGVWYVTVREIWRATHQRRGRPGLPPDPAGIVVPPDLPADVPPGQRY
ncbi:MAG: hypothetical protein AB7N91_15145 [Candidatus Tectimicrobiota bacterium]